ncbi:MAG: hypothetical protein JO257_13110 [Deltaproteobacteria bacterium]|nr:hypothetical protein [Deltaproteobacteria bacterium]
MRTVVLVCLLGACGSSSTAKIDAPAGGSADALLDAVDGTPTRQPCTGRFGTALTSVYGRLDGYLVAIVQPGSGSSCNGDSDHVHLQVKMNGAIYDVAINVGSSGNVDDVRTLTKDIPLPQWSEGWHPGAIEDYVSLGVHSTDMTQEPRAQIASEITADLASVNHISVFGTGYGPDGAHLIHRNGGGHDGMIVMNPLSSPAHVRMFSFTNQAF